MKKLVLTVMSLCLAVTMWGQTPAGSEWSPQVKQAATMIKENPAKASEAFDELMKGKNKKNTSLLVEIGRAYLDQGKTAEAAEYAQRAKDVNSKCAVAYLLSGDVALKLNDVNKASSDYNQAIYLDENCSEAYFRFLSVRLNRLKNRLLANYLRNRGNDLATVRNSAFCVAILSNNSFICKYNIFFRKYELSVAIL